MLDPRSPPNPATRSGFQALLRELEALPPPARQFFLSDNPMPPLYLEMSYMHPENLRAAIAVATRKGCVEVGAVHHRLGWSGPMTSALLRWGARRGCMERTAPRRYRVIRLPELPSPEPSSPAPIAL